LRRVGLDMAAQRESYHRNWGRGSNFPAIDDRRHDGRRRAHRCLKMRQDSYPCGALRKRIPADTRKGPGQGGQDPNRPDRPGQGGPDPNRPGQSGPRDPNRPDQGGDKDMNRPGQRGTGDPNRPEKREDEDTDEEPRRNTRQNRDDETGGDA
jgi:hypothetical protein